MAKKKGSKKAQSLERKFGATRKNGNVGVPMDRVKAPMNNVKTIL